MKNYPLAWEALIQLGKCTGKRIVYTKKEIVEKIRLEEFEKNKIIQLNEKYLSRIESGIEEELAPDLIQLLNSIIQLTGSAFYSDCFKMLTRNFEKLLKVIEILLENDCCFLTSNYMLTNTYIGKRTKLYRAAHTTAEMERKMKDSAFLNNLSKSHRIELKKFLDYFFKNLKN